MPTAGAKSWYVTPINWLVDISPLYAERIAVVRYIEEIPWNTKIWVAVGYYLGLI